MLLQVVSPLLLVGLSMVPISAQELRLPTRPADAPGGSEIVHAIRSMNLADREERIYAEIARGNVPSWLRRLRPVRMTREGSDGTHSVVFHAAPDYLAVGSDEDYFRVPLTPGTAQRVADLTGTSLPTPVMVDAIWQAAEVRLGPDSIVPGPEMTSVPVFERHEWRVEARRAVHDDPPGALVAGHHKDVVLSARLDTLPDRVAIYGWHRPDGRPIQPLYTGHTSDWVDYSHGVRLVGRTLSVDGVTLDLLDVLVDPGLASLVSDEGVIGRRTYGGRVSPGPSPDQDDRDGEHREREKSVEATEYRRGSAEASGPGRLGRRSHGFGGPRTHSEVVYRAQRHDEYEQSELECDRRAERRGPPPGVSKVCDSNPPNREIEGPGHQEHCEAQPADEPEALPRFGQEGHRDLGTTPAKPRHHHEHEKEQATDPDGRGEDVRPDGDEIQESHGRLERVASLTGARGWSPLRRA